MNFIYIMLSVFGLAAFVIAAGIKGEEIKKNLFFVFTGSMFVGISYLFTAAGINGAVSSFIGGNQVPHRNFSTFGVTLLCWEYFCQKRKRVSRVADCE